MNGIEVAVETHHFNGKLFISDQEQVVKELVSNFSDIANEKENGNLPIHFAAKYSAS